MGRQRVALDIKKLVAVMGMTGSVGDGEALNAVRLANRMLKAANKTWSDVIPVTIPRGAPDYRDFRTPPSKRKSKPGDAGRRYGRRAHQGPVADSGRHDDPQINDWLNDLAKRKHDLSTMMFLASITDQWDRKGWLSTAQFESVRRMHGGERL
jgi:hypothetical protein